jgi:hypothetical protein
MVTGAVNEEIRNTKTNKTDDEIENRANEVAFVLSVTMTGLVSVMR